MDVTGKRPVWSECNFPASNTVAKKILVSALIISIVIGTCVDLEFFLLGLSYFVLWPLT